MAYFLIPDAILFKFGPFLGNSTRVWRTDGRTDPLIEMRERISKESWRRRREGRGGRSGNLMKIDKVDKLYVSLYSMRRVHGWRTSYSSWNPVGKFEETHWYVPWAGINTKRGISEGIKESVRKPKYWSGKPILECSEVVLNYNKCKIISSMHIAHTDKNH